MIAVPIFIYRRALCRLGANEHVALQNGTMLRFGECTRVYARRRSPILLAQSPVLSPSTRTADTNPILPRYVVRGLPSEELGLQTIATVYAPTDGDEVSCDPPPGSSVPRASRCISACRLTVRELCSP